MENTKSRHSIGDEVVINLFALGKIQLGTIAGIKFTDYGKVLYDIKLFPFYNEEHNKNLHTILKDVDSYFIETEFENYKIN